jgi:hypothetical protein
MQCLMAADAPSSNFCFRISDRGTLRGSEVDDTRSERLVGLAAFHVNNSAGGPTSRSAGTRVIYLHVGKCTIFARALDGDAFSSTVSAAARQLQWVPSRVVTSCRCRRYITPSHAAKLLAAVYASATAYIGVADSEGCHEEPNTPYILAAVEFN